MINKFTHLFNKLCTVLAVLFVVGVGNAWGARAIVSIADYATANSWENGTKYGTININSDVTATGGGTTNNTKYYEAAPGTWNFYQTGSGIVTISTTNGTLNSVTFVFSDANYGTISYSESALTSKTACAVSGTSASFNVSATSGTTGQIKISFIIVDYTPTNELTTFYRISSMDDLLHGDEIIFVNQDENKACSTTQNTNNRSSVEISTSDYSYTKTGSDNVQVFYVMKNGDNYGFFANDGFIYAASKSDNNLKTTNFGQYAQHRVTSTHAWTASVANNIFSFYNTTDGYTDRYLAFFSNIFTQYNTTQKKPYIYKVGKKDYFVDIMHGNTVPYMVGRYYMPNIDDADKGSDTYAEEKHYKFVGWVIESDMNSDGSLKSGYTLYLPGSAMTGSNTTYYAVWAKDVE